ncbi:PUTATIVE TWO-COMPONENT SENSOR [hydrothermal vent metagenome]|uniref:PUTATIVE TWO-COMPONENT SENSOR n=1 Tax=hydrothermal vent metagenome TaxID=652676 RepID=A0A1W1CQB6_9ZZZZ
MTMQAQMGMATEEEIEKTMHFIEITTQDMSKTINDFMNFTKPTDEKVRILFQEIVDDILRMMGAQLKNHNIDFIEEIEDNLMISTFNKELEHILINLFSNARDALDTKEIENKEIRLCAFAKGKDCVIEVRDNAGGIAKDVISRVFDPYFTTKEQGKGTGLGLYMSKKILTETIGGHIDVCNTQDGAKFTITLKGAVC